MKWFCRLLFSSALVLSASPAGEIKDGIPSRIEQLLSDHSAFSFGDPADWQTEILEMMPDVYGDSALAAEVESVMIDFMLSNATYAARKMIWAEFANIVTDRSIPSLLHMLDDEMASQLALLIIQKADLKDEEALAARLSSLPDREKIAIINHFGANREEDAIGLLHEFARSANPLISMSAIAALGRIGTIASAEILVATLDQPGRPIDMDFYDALLNCAEHLAAIGDDERAVSLYEICLEPKVPVTSRSAASYGLFRLSDQPLEFVSRNLRTSAPEMRSVFIRMVGDLPSSFVEGHDLLQAEGLAPGDRMQLLLILASRKDPSVRRYALESLEDEDKSVRETALQALTRIATADDVDRLLEFAVQAEENEKDLAVRALSAIPGDDVDDRLRQNFHNALPEVLLVLMAVCGERGTASVADTLFRVARSEIEKVQIEAIRTLGVVGEYSEISKALDSLLEAGTVSQRRAWERTVYQLARKSPVGTQPSAEIMRRLHQARDEANVASLVIVLGELKHPADYQVLRPYLQDSHVDIQIRTIEVLSDWPNSDPLDDLIRTFESSGNASLRGPALKGSLRLINADRGMPDSAKLGLVGSLMEEAQNRSERAWVISAYGEIENIDSLVTLVSLLRDPGNETTAEAAIRKIMRNVYIDAKEEARAAILQAGKLSESDEFRQWIDDGLRRERFQR